MKPIAFLVCLTGLLCAPVVAEEPPPASPPADAVRLESGLVTQVRTPADGPTITAPADIVLLRYRGWTESGVLFEEVGWDRPISLPLNNSIVGWQQGIALMHEGETRRLWIPAELGFNGMTGKPAGTVIYDIELVRVIQNPPPSFRRPPSEATLSPSGLGWLQLAEGTGEESPGINSVVSVHFTSWKITGELVESTYFVGRPNRTVLSVAYLGWQEIIPQMLRGERRRLWLPDGMAYFTFSGKPLGSMIFDIELVDFVEPKRGNRR